MGVRENLSLITPRRPRGKEWVRVPVPPQYIAPIHRSEGWFRPDKRILVLSVVDPNATDNDVMFHLSISRCAAEDVTETLRVFGMESAHEANEDASSRHFWKLVEKKARK